MIRPVAAAAMSHANTLAGPRKPEITEGNPKMPLPMMQLMVSAARLQRPMARTSVDWPGWGTAGLYHKMSRAGVRGSQEGVSFVDKAGTFLLWCDTSPLLR